MVSPRHARRGGVPVYSTGLRPRAEPTVRDLRLVRPLGRIMRACRPDLDPHAQHEGGHRGPHGGAACRACRSCTVPTRGPSRVRSAVCAAGVRDRRRARAEPAHGGPSSASPSTSAARRRRAGFAPERLRLVHNGCPPCDRLRAGPRPVALAATGSLVTSLSVFRAVQARRRVPRCRPADPRGGARGPCRRRRLGPAGGRAARAGRRRSVSTPSRALRSSRSPGRPARYLVATDVFVMSSDSESLPLAHPRGARLRRAPGRHRRRRHRRGRHARDWHRRPPGSARRRSPTRSSSCSRPAPPRGHAAGVTGAPPAFFRVERMLRRDRPGLRAACWDEQPGDPAAAQRRATVGPEVLTRLAGSRRCSSRWRGRSVPTELGEYAFAVAFAMILWSVAGLGIDRFAMREVARDAQAGPHARLGHERAEGAVRGERDGAVRRRDLAGGDVRSHPASRRARGDAGHRVARDGERLQRLSGARADGALLRG